MSSHPTFDPRESAETLRRQLADLEASLAGTLRATGADVSAEIRQLLGMLIEALPLFVAILSPEGRLLYINAHGLHMINLGPERMHLASLESLFPPTAYERILAAGFPFAQRHTIWQEELILQTMTGAEIPVALMLIAHRGRDGQLRFFSVIGRDIRAQRRAEAALLEQATLLEKASEAILLKTLDDRIVRWNSGASRIYGWTEAEVANRPGREVFKPQGEAYDLALEATRTHGSWNGELVKKTREGKTVVVDSRWTLIRNADGAPYCMLTIDADITTQKHLQAQFLRTQRMESIGALAGGIAHDLNNILAPILMGVGLLRLKLSDEEGLQTLASLETSARRGAELVKQVLSFSRGMDGQHAAISPVRLITEMQQIILETFPKSIRLETRIADDAWNVKGDLTQLHQVLLNLCVNARDAMPEGGKLELLLANMMLDEAYATMNSEARPGPYVVIEVVDTGVGIAPDVRNKIFEPFFTTKEPGHGTGLGLSTAYAIVKGHGGFLNVYSELGKGTQIKVYLPAHPKLAAPVRNPDKAPVPWGRGETVLVVDDEENIGQLAQRTLERYGYRAITARNGAEAVACYAKKDPPVDLVLSDMAMPVMDGPALIIALRNIDPNVLVVGASGLGSNSQFVHAIGAGLRYFLHKPYTGSALLRTVRQALDEK